MKLRNPHLDRLGAGYTQILVFDCEFWRVLGHPRDVGLIYEKKKDFFFVPREIGGFLLLRDGDGWDLQQKFYVTLGPPPPEREVALPVSHYATVTPQTGWKLDEIERQLSMPWGEAYPSRLSPQEAELWRQGVQLYMQDREIRSAHKPHTWILKFMEIYSNSLVVVKGTNDIKAFQNACTLYGYDYTPPRAVLDIAVWNDQSRQMCGSAKLEETFRCVKDSFDDNIGDGTRIRDLLPLGKAHDPSVDASMTLLIALYIISK